MIHKIFQTITLTFLVITGFQYSLLSQQLWTDVDFQSITQSRNEENPIPASIFRTVDLDLQQWEQILPKRQATTKINLPLPTGEIIEVNIRTSSILEKELAEKYPAAKTYTIYSEENSQLSGRLSYTPNGVHAILFHPLGTVYVEPLHKGIPTFHASYFAKNQTIQRLEGIELSCGQPLLPTEIQKTTIPTAESRGRGVAVDLKVYRLILSNTGEFADYHNARLKGEVIFEFVELLTFVNAIFERDFAIRFELINETEDLIFLDAASDPYEGNGSVFSLAQQSSFVIETRVAVNKFDIGHILTADCFTGGGAVGVVTGPACSVTKSQGVSCQFQNNTVFAANVFAHEIGHQFAASHSWSNCDGSEGQRAETPYEPGSGSTIMSYAGACGPQNNIQQRSDAYFHVANIEQVERFQESNATCGTNMRTSNIAPEAIILQEDGLVIPFQTPFELKGEAMDENGDELTYCWEQFDLGPASTLNSPRGNSPTFRSFPPSNNPNRIVPRLQNILTNTFDNKEVLPTYTRDLTFRLTVRDNHSEAGGVDWKEVSFSATEAAGPFVVKYPNTGTDVVRVGESVNVEWAVANTNASPVNCQKVDILLSLDGGRTYPEILAKEVANDGSQIVTIPEINSNRARIKVAAANNIFFDISDFDFDILNPTQSGFSFATSIQSQEICLPDQVAIDLNTVSLLDFQKAISFEVVAGLPEGALTTFENISTDPGNSNRLTIDFQNVTIEGDFEVEVRGVANNADTISRTIDFKLIRNDFSDLQLMMPANNSQGVASPSYAWQPSEDAISYDIEVATSPAFGNTVIDRAINLRTPEYPSRETLNPSTIYYWRVIPSNECGIGVASEIFAFQTERLICTRVESDQVPLFISAQGTPTVQSTLDFSSALTISDINVIGLKGRHDQVRHIAARLISPKETTVTLFSGKCFSVPINVSFDDESLVTELCPANDGQTKAPLEALADFDGENANGTWTLEIEVINSDGEGGSIDEWGLELCSNASVDPPILIINNMLPVQPTKGRIITNEFLLSEDANNTASELMYTVVALPAVGQLLRGNTPLMVGQIFTQADLDNERIVYRNEENSTASKDAFRFDVTDGEGGWIGITSFDIVLDETELITDVEEVLDEQQVRIFPNPADQTITVYSDLFLNHPTHYNILNSQGQLWVAQKSIQDESVQLDISALPQGVYFLEFYTDTFVTIRRFVVQR